ncbi:hypothetical protein MJN85_31225, partial [Salmonella enterica subsp. enterica serovar Anatum]|nr:hypothetical protein [Salmonella enterica subsp. enterica serovar Anatum]
GVRAVPGIGDKRQPLWPDGLFGSISHCATTALAVISRQRVGINEAIPYSISERPTMPMIDDILMKAFARLDAGTNPVLHSDQGW